MSPQPPLSRTASSSQPLTIHNLKYWLAQLLVAERPLAESAATVLGWQLTAALQPVDVLTTPPHTYPRKIIDAP